MVTSGGVKVEEMSNAIKVINIEGKYRLLPAIINTKIIEVSSIYLHAYWRKFFHSDVSLLFMNCTFKFSIYVRTSLGQVADHISVCLSGRICDTIARICQKDIFIFMKVHLILMVTTMRWYFISESKVHYERTKISDDKLTFTINYWKIDACGSNPMSSILSASSSTKYVTLLRFVAPPSRWSIKRPGVAMTISTPFLTVIIEVIDEKKRCVAGLVWWWYGERIDWFMCMMN